MPESVHLGCAATSAEEGARVRRSRAIVTGRVQGVGMRMACARAARSHGVAGWVRNLPDGRVEAQLEGSDEAVEEMVRWLHGGARHARVDGVELSEMTPEAASGFDVR